MAVVSSAAQFFSAPASGSPAGAASGAASLFGTGGGMSLGAGLVEPTGQAAEAVATFENLLAALINGDGASLQSALKAAVADGAVTMDHGKLALGPALQQIAPPDLASGKPALDQLIADGKAAPAAALLAMLLNGDGDVPSIQIEVAPESAPSAVAADLASASPVEPAPTTDAGAAECGKPVPVSAVEIIRLQGPVLPASAAATEPPALDATPSKPKSDSLSDAGAAIAAAAETAGASLDDGTALDGAALDADVSDEDVKAAREQAALDLMAALLAQQPPPPPPVVAKPDVALTIEAATAPMDPAPLTDLPAAPIVVAPKPAGGTLTPAPEKEPDFASELAPAQADALAPKHLAAAKVESPAHAPAAENFVPVTARPVNDGAPAAPQPATASNAATASASAAAGATGGDTGADLNSDGQPQSDNGQRQPAEVDLLRSGAAIADSGRAAGHQDFAGQLAGASRGSHGSGSSPQMPAFQQVAVQIRRAVIDGDDHLSIQLKPVELGRIDVRLHFTGDGRVSAHVTADNVATLDLMQRDTRGLERALQDAGLQTDSGSLSFNLRGDNRQAHDQPDNRGAQGNARFTLDGQVEPEPEDLPAGRWVPAGRVDVRV